MERLFKLLWIAGAVLLVGFLILSPYAAIKGRAAEPVAAEKILTATMESGWIVRIWEAPCTNAHALAITVAVKHDQVPMWLAGESFSPDRKEHLELCWGVHKSGLVLVVDENGDYGKISPEVFQPLLKGAI